MIGRGTTVLAVIRAGTLRVADAILCGSMSGKAREIARDQPPAASRSPSALGLLLLCSGACCCCGQVRAIRHMRTPGESSPPRAVQSATAGDPVSVSVAWSDVDGAGSFAVGDLLVVLPRADAEMISRYLQMVESFMAMRTPYVDVGGAIGDSVKGDVSAGVEENACHVDVEESGGGIGHVDAEESGGGIGHVDVEECGGGIGHVDVEESGGGVGHVDVEESGGGVGHVDVKESGGGIGHVSGGGVGAVARGASAAVPVRAIVKARSQSE